MAAPALANEATKAAATPKVEIVFLMLDCPGINPPRESNWLEPVRWLLLSENRMAGEIPPTVSAESIFETLRTCTLA
jgi:ribosome biogenesis GTPase A